MESFKKPKIAIYINKNISIYGYNIARYGNKLLYVESFIN